MNLAASKRSISGIVLSLVLGAAPTAPFPAEAIICASD